jgi:hypothetical protein
VVHIATPVPEIMDSPCECLPIAREYSDISGGVYGSYNEKET